MTRAEWEAKRERAAGMVKLANAHGVALSLRCDGKLWGLVALDVLWEQGKPPDIRPTYQPLESADA